MSDDLIRRSDAIKVIDRMKHRLIGNGCTYEFMRQMIEELPTIEPKRGEWIDMGDFEQCSVCKGTHLKEFQSYYGKTTWIKTPYCPHCGCAMTKE